jgi:hypothetical protein
VAVIIELGASGDGKAKLALTHQLVARWGRCMVVHGPYVARGGRTRVPCRKALAGHTFAFISAILRGALAVRAGAWSSTRSLVGETLGRTSRPWRRGLVPTFTNQAVRGAHSQ